MHLSKIKLKEYPLKYIFAKTSLLLLCVLVNLVTSDLISQIGKVNNHMFFIGSYGISVSSAQGVLTGIRSLSCVLMVFISYTAGIIPAIVLILLNIIHSVYPIILLRSLTPLPGAISSVVSLVSVLIIYSFYKKAVIKSYTDYISGLNNRRSYVKEAGIRIAAGKSFCLACVEIEGFKSINDIFGILAGDYILKQTAEKFKLIAGKNATVFKITGAMFAIIFDDLNSNSSPEEKIRQIIKPDVIGIPSEDWESKTIEKTCVISYAAGYTYVQPPYSKKKSASSILKDTETALLVAHNYPENKICAYNETLENEEIKQKEAELLILESLENELFYLVYQPQYTTAEKKLRGFETLIRCKKPDGSIVSPALFIPAAEKTSLIMRIDDYVLRKAMTECKALVDGTEDNLVISINVSAKNISSDNFASKIKEIIKETEFPPEHLEIEITEYSFAESGKTIANINELKELGIQIALDDFGTGYTSIAQLMKLPVNLLKIDKSLIDDIENSQVMRDMVDSVIYMGHIMNCEVISEGVENENQLKLLLEHKCDFIQGFVWGKPQSYDEVKRLCGLK